MRFFVIVALLLSTNLSLAGLTLDADTSRLNFTSIKNNSVAELHRFTRLSGEVSNEGKLVVQVSLDSVDTRIEIRDRRMRESFFETAKFPLAVFKADVEIASLANMAEGEIQQREIQGTLELHGQSAPLTLLVRVVKATNGALVVSTLEPAFINVGDYGLVEGVNKLRKLAGLQSIVHAVPVSFSAVFR